MKFVLKPLSLEHMALVKIVVSFWNHNDVRALISKLSYDDLLSIVKWKTIEETVREKVTQLLLPKLLKEKVFDVIKPIGLELIEWLKYYDRYNIIMGLHRTCLPPRLLAKLCWTSQGTVDRRRTAELLVRDEKLDISRRYSLACDYCLENDIVRFWNKLPENLKNYDWSDFPVISFWSDNMKRGRVGDVSYKDVFYSSAHYGSKVAARYFLQKLTPQEIEESLEELADDIDDVDVLCFLLPELEEEQQMLVFESDPCGVLQCFLRWPYQGFFIQIANCMWDLLPKDNYDGILGNIIGKVKDGYKDYNYQKLFGEFWQKIPSALKDSLLEDIEESLLTLLFHIKDKENIRLILKNATLTAKSKLIYNVTIGYYLTRSIRENDFDFVEFCIRELLSSKTEMLKFKEKFERRVYFKECTVTERHKWDCLFSFSDDVICQYGKRNVEEGESSSSKRFQSLQ